MKQPLHPALRRYLTAEISALRAAALIGDHATVADVVTMVKQAGLEPPRRPLAEEHAELRRARKVLGL